MKKIMFNDALGLTQAVLKGCKTSAKRIVNVKVFINGREVGVTKKIVLLFLGAFRTPYETFRALIGKLDKKMWERNPWVFVYDFELVN